MSLSSSKGKGILTTLRTEFCVFVSAGAIFTSRRQRMWGQLHLLRFARSEGRGGVKSEVFEPEVGLRNLVMGEVEGGRKGG